MAQSRLYAETGEETAKSLIAILETEYAEEGFPIAAFENLENPGNWDVSLYVDTTSAESVFARINSLAIENGVRIEFVREDLPEIDWVSKSQAGLHPVRAGRIIVHGSHDTTVPKPNEVSVCLDAGMAFGTGHHGTTTGCLLALDRLSKQHSFRRVLDLGTGSGVLAIAAAKMHNALVLASDLDPLAVSVARENIRKNGSANRITPLVANGFENPAIRKSGPFDLIIANILAGPLRKFARDLAHHLAPGGIVILSGLLPHQKASITATYRAHGLVLRRWLTVDGWLTIVLERKT